MKVFHLVPVVLPLLLVVSCAGESTQEKQAQLCTDLATLNSAVANLRSLSPSSTVGDLRKADENVKQAFNAVQTSAEDVQSAELEDLQQAKDNLDKAVRDIPAQATLQEATASISDEAAALQNAEAQLRTGVNCP